MTLDDWRVEQAPEEYTIVILPVLGSVLLSKLIRSRYSCGHWAPARYALEMDGKISESEFNRKSASCPECTIKQMRKGFSEFLAAAIPCSNCVGPIFLDEVVGACIPPTETNTPIVYFADGLAPMCRNCAFSCGVLAGVWTGTDLKRLYSAEEFAEYGVEICSQS